MTHSRRSFLKTSGAAASGLVLGFYVTSSRPRGPLRSCCRDVRAERVRAYLVRQHY